MNDVKNILHMVGFSDNLEGSIIPRENLLSFSKYCEIQKLIPNLKMEFSSSFMTCLQENASDSQKWPLLNLVRQLLSVYHYKMVPIRKSDGYVGGHKKYKRFFLIQKCNI